jgi:hypothetical protein
MTVMDIRAKFAEYESIIKMLTARCEEQASEIDRLTSALGGAHATLRSIYSDQSQPAGVRVKAAQAALPHETPRLNPVSQLELAADPEPEPLHELVARQRARADRMMLEPPFSDLPKVIPFRPNGNGRDDDSND